MGQSNEKQLANQVNDSDINILQKTFFDFVEIYCEVSDDNYTDLGIFEGAFLTYLVNERSAVASAELWKKQTNNINKCLSLQFGNFKIAGLKCQPVVVGIKLKKWPI